MWTVDPEPEVKIGGYDGRPEYTLHEVIGATRLQDGRLVVANRGSSELKIFDASGLHVRNLGGPGQGPGELRGILRLQRLAADTLLVLSLWPGLTWYSAEGGYLRSTPLELVGSPNHPCRVGETWNWHLVPTGAVVRLLEDNTAPAFCGPTPDGVWRRSGLLGVPDFEGQTFDTIALLPASERVGGRFRVFGHTVALAFGKGRVYAGDTESETILALGMRGDTLATIPAPFEPRSIPTEIKDEGLLEVEQPDGSIRLMPGYSDYPEVYPRYGRLMVDEAGYLWIMEYPNALEPFHSWRLTAPVGGVIPSEASSWRVLSPEGDAVAAIQIPPEFYPLEIGTDYVLGVSRDDLGVETVSLHRLVR